ncbi:MAG: FtsX-like permease family protein [Chlorobi bacterium]|nr:FtsX-like permease family protein [Chlorobiota bacterium]
MFFLNLKTFFKHLTKNKLYLVITVLGFTISLTFVIMLSVYIKNELSVNSLQINKDRIFRVRNEKFANLSPPIGGWLQSEIPEIECYTRTFNSKGFTTTTDDTKISFDYLLADSAFFKMFSFNLIEGTPETALQSRNSIVLTRSFAKKLFGNKSPVGKQLRIDDRVSCRITGVVDDISKSSNFKKCDAIINFRSLVDLWQSPGLLDNFGNCSFDLYIMARPNTDLPATAPKILKLFKEHFWLYQENMVKKVILEPFSETYFSHIEGNEINQNSKTLVLILLAIVVLILILSIINYMNLTMAQTGTRVKEMAIKKLMGSSRNKLIVQHVFESVILCTSAFLLAIVLSFMAEPVFNDLLNTRLNLSQEFTGSVLFILILSVISIGILSGIVPATIITRLKAVDVLKGGFRRKTKTVYSKMLIGFQYAVVIALLISTFVISRQTHFMQNHNPGFNSNGILRLPCALEPHKYPGLRNKLMEIPGVKSVSFVRGDPIDGGNNNTFKYHDKMLSFQVFEVDSAFFDMMKLKVTRTDAAKSHYGIFLNRTAVKALELDSLPVSVKMYDRDIPVLGVVNDFNFRSLHKKIGPVMISFRDTSNYAWSILVQIEGNNIIPTADKVKSTYSKFIDGIPFDARFFDESIQEWYEKEKKTSKIVSYFALLTVIISVMGIYAMSIFYNQQRTKEIGIRKVNGATVREIVALLNKDFVKWVVIAFFVAAPVAWYAMHRWLENFAYKIELSWWIFVLAGLTALFIALLTVSWHTFRAARRNPVEALRYE